MGLALVLPPRLVRVLSIRPNATRPGKADAAAGAENTQPQRCSIRSLALSSVELHRSVPAASAAVKAACAAASSGPWLALSFNR